MDWSHPTLTDLEHFLLAFFRVTGVLMVAPVFGSAQIPPQIRAFLSFLIAVLVFPFVDRTGAVVAPNIVLYLYAVLLEWGLGLILGMAARVLFMAVQFGGQLIDQELGLSLANVIDPITQEQVSVIGQMKLILATLIYILVDGHHFVIAAVAHSFQTVPLMGLTMTGEAARVFTMDMMQDVLVAGVQVAAPALFAMMLTSVGLAIMARAVPEMNIFAIGFSLRLLFGFTAIALAIPVFEYVFAEARVLNEQSVQDILLHLRGP